MTYAPHSLTELAGYWRRHGGRQLGIVGDLRHADDGTSYHLGRSQLTATAYSRRTARDRRGLTEAASAIDLGRLGGSLGALRDFSAWLVERARADADGTRDMREIIYSPDGALVLRWDRERGYASAARPGEADKTHTTHTHVSWYRDAELRDHTTAFRPYFEEAAPMRSFEVLDGPSGTVTVEGHGHAYLALDDGTIHTIGDQTVKSPAHAIRLTEPIPGGEPGADRRTGWLVGVRAAFLLASDVSFIATTVDAALRVGRELERERIATAEAERIRHL